MSATADNMNLQFLGLSISARGVKTCPVATLDEAPLYYTFDTLTHAPFGPSSFDKDPNASRMQLDMRLSGADEEYFELLDRWAMASVLEHSEKLFKKKLTPEQVEERYHPILRKSEKHPTLLKTKINLHGNRPCMFWNSKEEIIGAPDDWKGLEFRARVHVSHLWLMGSDCGLVLNCADLLLLDKASVAFPF